MNATNDRNDTEMLSDLYRFGDFEIIPCRVQARIGDRVCEVGINNAPYMISRNYGTQMCPAFKLWAAMLLKAREENLSIQPEWLFFMRFRAWLSTQPWRSAVLDNSLTTRLSYDLSEETAILVPKTYHRTLCMLREWQIDPDSRMKAGDVPKGVTYYGRNGKYQAKIRKLGSKKQTHLGYYPTIDEAREVYDEALADNLVEIQGNVEDTNPRLAAVIEELLYVI